MQQAMPHQVMGYDRAITMFSPDGRLLQVEYAKKTVRQGSTAIGMVCKDGVILVTDKRLVDKLVVPEGIEKIWQIDDHICTTASGIISDAHVLVERARTVAQQHQITYDNPSDVLNVVKEICSLKQICTQSGGLRPFGVSLIFAGVDNGVAKLFETDPTGIYFQYRATVIGEGESEIEKILHSKYEKTLSMEEGLKLALKSMKKVLDNDFSSIRVDAAYISLKEKRFNKFSKAQLDKALR